MVACYKIEFFRDEDNNYPVRLFLDQLDAKKRAAIVSGIATLGQIGLGILSMNLGNDINDHLWEVKKGDRRIIFTRQGNTFILLHGFEKFQKTTPRVDKKIAEARYSEYMREHKK